MPTNVSVFYLRAEQEYHEAKTSNQKLAALKKMLSLCPKHKGAEKLQKQIKERIRRLKYQRQKENQQKKTGRSLTIKREGAAQIAIVGLPNSGKSTLLSKLSGKKVNIAEYPFTTKKPEIRMIPFENIKLQGMEIPAIYEGFAKTTRGRQFLSIVRNADMVLIIVKDKEDEKKVIKELTDANIKAGKDRIFKEFVQYLPFITVNQSEFDDPTLKKEIWKKLSKIRVQTRTKGGVAKKPIILRVGSTVKKVAGIVHKDFLKNFKYAKIWGPSAKFKGQQVGLGHKLKDTDVVEIYTK